MARSPRISGSNRKIRRAVRVLAQRAGTTPEAVVVEAVHDRLAGFAASLAPPSRRAGRRKG